MTRAQTEGTYPGHETDTLSMSYDEAKRAKTLAGRSGGFAGAKLSREIAFLLRQAALRRSDVALIVSAADADFLCSLLA